jgi:hypothetical protein
MSVLVYLLRDSNESPVCPIGPRSDITSKSGLFVSFVDAIEGKKVSAV